MSIENPFSSKNSSRTLVFFLCLFFGLLGVHRFYLKKYKTAFLMLITLGGCGIWYFLDLFWIITGKLKKKERHLFSFIKKMATKVSK